MGVNWIDFNNDGWADLFAVNGHPNPAHLYRNDNGAFTKVDELLPPLPVVDMSGSIFADYDNDGDQDIYIYTDNEQYSLMGLNDLTGPPNILLQNQWVENGGATIPGVALFVDVAAAAGVDDLAPTAITGTYMGMRAKTANWLDYDVDGCIDLFVGHLVFQAEGTAANRDRLYKNDCTGSFTDESELLYPATAEAFPGERQRSTLASIATDLTGDGLPELYLVSVASIEHYPTIHHDRVLWNRGGWFQEIQFPGVGDDAHAGMGIDVADIELDGDYDLYITDLNRDSFDSDPVGNILYLNQGSFVADNSAPMAGVSGDDSWGANFFDADQDGYEDLLVMTMASATSGPFLYHNLGNGSFSDMLGLSSQFGNLRGSAIADFDRDGDLDIAGVQQGGGLVLFRNTAPSPGGWLQLDLQATNSNRSAIGAEVVVRAQGMTMRRQIKGGSSGHGQDDLIVHFGLAAAAIIDRVTVHWPSGAVSTLTDIAPNQRLTIAEF